MQATPQSGYQSTDPVTLLPGLGVAHAACAYAASSPGENLSCASVVVEPGLKTVGNGSVRLRRSQKHNTNAFSGSIICCVVGTRSRRRDKGHSHAHQERRKIRGLVTTIKSAKSVAQPLTTMGQDSVVSGYHAPCVVGFASSSCASVGSASAAVSESSTTAQALPVLNPSDYGDGDGH